jgi:RND superfamily putative drug exporter
MFERLGWMVSRYWFLVLGVWVVGVAALRLWAPPFEEVTKDDDIRFFPPEYSTVQGLQLLQKSFPEDAGSSELVIVVVRENGKLSPADFAFVDLLTRRLNEVRQSFPERDYRLGQVVNYATPVLGQLLISQNQRATLLMMHCGWPFTAAKVIEVTTRIRSVLRDMVQRGEIPEGLRVATTGSAAVGADMQIAQQESLDASLIWTIILVVGILLLVYRSPMLAVIPLVTITLSIICSKALLASLALIPGLNFQVMKITDIFIVVLLFGAGTDYCLFLIARYREEWQQGRSSAEAVQQAISRVGGALVASAGTVICGLSTMYFARFGKISYTGPAVALSLAVALVACLTMAPALLRLLGEWAFWPQRRVAFEGLAATGVAGPLGQRFWDGLSRTLVRRPVWVWGTATALMLPFAVWAPYTPVSYDFLAELSADRDSKQGYFLVQRYFSPGELGPLMIILDSRQELVSPAGRDAMAQLEARLEQVPHVRAVRSVQDPLGLGVLPRGQEPGTKEASRDSRGSTFLDVLGRLPDQVQRTLVHAAVVNHYISPRDRTVGRLYVVLDVPPFSQEAMHAVARIREELGEFVREGPEPLRNAHWGLAGTPAAVFDLRDVTLKDELRINILVVLAVYAVLVALLRRPALCLYLLLTVLFSYYATLGLTDLLFRTKALLAGQEFVGLDWKVGFFLFVILVAVGEDYNIFLMARVVEEQERLGWLRGIQEAVLRTGGIISSCGLIMAGTFFSMMTGTLTALIELGFALGFGVLLDTFVVRPMLVPAFLVFLGKLRGQQKETGFAVQPSASEETFHPVA